MAILVFGKTGQVARELQNQAEVIALGRDEADLSDPAACEAAIRRHAPHAVINAAAYTAVDDAEREEVFATIVNGNSPAVMARVCAELDIPFVHISSDYVFDGSGTGPRKASEIPSPISAYGRSKLAGEVGVQEAGGRFAILRTSWVFSAYGQNFVKTMLRLGAERGQLNIVADQIGGPTSANSIASVCLAIANALESDVERAGIFHFAGYPDASWADFAREIFAAAEIDCEVCDISSSEYPTPAKRPLNSRLDCSNTEDKFGIIKPDWRVDLQNVLETLDKRKGHS